MLDPAELRAYVQVSMNSRVVKFDYSGYMVQKIDCDTFSGR